MEWQSKWNSSIGAEKLLSVLQRAARQLIMHWLMTFAQAASQRVDGIDKCATSKTRINRRVNTER